MEYSYKILLSSCRFKLRVTSRIPAVHTLITFYSGTFRIPEIAVNDSLFSISHYPVGKRGAIATWKEVVPSPFGNESRFILSSDVFHVVHF